MAPTTPEPVIEALVRESMDAQSFDEAALVALRTMRRVAAEALAASAFAQSGRVVRCVLHLRPADGYRGLAVLEAGARELSAPSERGARLTSTTAWRWVSETRRGVSIDVNVGRIAFHGAAKAVRPRTALPPGQVEFNGGETRLGLIARDVTHLLVLPLRVPLGAVDGMVAIEAACRPAMGTPFFWESCADHLQLVADVVAPYVGRLPIKAGGESAVDPFLPVVGASMSALTEMLATFAQQEEPILITGPTGSGKSRLARWCHERSQRRGKPFEVLDLCATPEPLQMAELFGWRKGAFTGAARDKAGYIARAKGGTVFIDEIDSLSPRAQSGLLRVLEAQTYRRLGDDGCELLADVRFIVGTNASLRSAVREKRFREDLYYRINVLPVTLPPLKERADEVCPWARFMANRRHAQVASDEGVSMTTAAESLLVAHPWPGNLRQLDNIVRRAYAVAAMMHGGRPPASLVLDETHFRRAMAYEEQPEERSLSDILLAAAASFVQEAERRGAGVLDLDMTEVFKGFVLGAAAEKLGGNRDEAFALFGREKLAKSRNHHKVLRREIGRVEEFCRALGDPRVPFAGLLDASEKETPAEQPSPMPTG